MMKCPNCGNSVEPNDAFCGECGQKLERHAQSVNNAEKEISQAQSQDSEPSHATSKSEQSVAQQTTSNENQHLQHETTQDARTQQHPQTHQTSTYQNNQYQSSSNQQHTQNNQQQFDQFSNHAKEVTQESKGFFKSAFVAPDEVIKSKHAFSFKLLLSLLIGGFLVVAILLAMTIPSDAADIIGGKGSIIMSMIIGMILFLAVIVGATFAITRLVVRQSISFRKVLSDYVLINSVSVALLLISFVLLTANSYVFSTSVFVLSILLFVISGIYMIAKYSVNSDVRFSSFYGVIIYIIIIFLFISIFGESFLHQIINQFTQNIGDFLDNDFFNGGGYSY